ncbi:MAG: hypothetical protein ACK42A_06895 [Pyrinomonadaceae bacterium]
MSGLRKFKRCRISKCEIFRVTTHCLATLICEKRQFADGTRFAVASRRAGYGTREEIVMYAKIYFVLWAIILAVFAVMYLLNLLTDIAVVVLGFIFFGMLFMGLISVLPSSVHDSLIRH